MSETNGLFAGQLRRTKREMLGMNWHVTVRYRCLRCQHEGDVSDVVIDGFVAGCVPLLRQMQRSAA